MAAPPPSSATATTVTSMYDIPRDIIRADILPRLDGPTLGSTSCVSTELHSLISSNQELWVELCHSTWPSTRTPRVDSLISSFSSSGHHSFFFHSFPPLTSELQAPRVGRRPPGTDHEGPLSELIISAVDIFYRNELIFSKVVETETSSAWFLCSPFRLDMLGPKDTCPTPIRRETVEEMTLSWIVIDPAAHRAVNLSTHCPVEVHQHWLSGEVYVRYATIVPAREGGGELVQCSMVVVVTCDGGGGGGAVHVREVSLQVEDMEGTLLNGKDSLGILCRTLEGKKGILRGGVRREEEGKKRYEMFLEMKRERKERKLRAERTLDMFCVGFGVVVSFFLGSFLLLRF